MGHILAGGAKVNSGPAKEGTAPSKPKCSICGEELLPDDRCPRCFNRHRRKTAWAIFLASSIAGSFCLAWFMFSDPSDQGYAFVSYAFVGSILIGFGALASVVYNAIVPAETPNPLGTARGLNPPKAVCAVCQQPLDDTKWCRYCSQRRRQLEMLLLAVCGPLLGIGACSQVMGGVPLLTAAVLIFGFLFTAGLSVFGAYVRK